MFTSKARPSPRIASRSPEPPIPKRAAPAKGIVLAAALFALVPQARASSSTAVTRLLMPPPLRQT